MPIPLVISATASSTSQHSASRGGRKNSQPSAPTFDADLVNFHRVEFEAPHSSDLDSEPHKLQREQGQGRFSIDYSLELERELAMESPPETPAHDVATHPDTTKHSSQSSHSNARLNDLAPDPEVLAHIIMQLRQSLADMAKEKEELVKMLAMANSQEAYAKDALQAMTDKATEAEDELTELRKKMKDDEEQIVLLRAKVEESRRGLMRLQTENRRSSMAPIDIARASAGTFASFTSPPSSKRSSFVPLTGSGISAGHRRTPSVNETNLTAIPTPDQTPSPNIHAFNIASAEASLSGAPSSSRRFSGLFGRQSPPNPDMLDSADIAAEASAHALELDVMRKEMQAIKDQLDNMKHELIEANEAKEASETCVTALREFIAENNVGMNGPSTNVKLPPPPTMTTGEELSADPRKTGSGWGFKLWGNAPVDSPLKSSIGNAPYSASPAASLPMAPSASMPPPTATIGAAPLSRKLGGFFSSRSSISSNHSQQPTQPLHLQTNAAVLRLPSQRDSIYSHSDASSVAEPISPSSDIHGLGTAPYYAKPEMLGEEDALVKDASNLDASSVHVSISASDMEGLR